MRKRGYTFSTHKIAWNRKLPFPSRKVDGRILFEVEPDRWVTRQRAWQVQTARERASIAFAPTTDHCFRLVAEEPPSTNAVDPVGSRSRSRYDARRIVGA